MHFFTRLPAAVPSFSDAGCHLLSVCPRAGGWPDFPGWPGIAPPAGPHGHEPTARCGSSSVLFGAIQGHGLASSGDPILRLCSCIAVQCRLCPAAGAEAEAAAGMRRRAGTGSVVPLRLFSGGASAASASGVPPPQPPSVPCILLSFCMGLVHRFSSRLHFDSRCVQERCHLPFSSATLPLLVPPQPAAGSESALSLMLMATRQSAPVLVRGFLASTPSWLSHVHCDVLQLCLNLVHAFSAGSSPMPTRSATAVRRASPAEGRYACLAPPGPDDDAPEVEALPPGTERNVPGSLSFLSLGLYAASDWCRTDSLLCALLQCRTCLT